MHIRLLPAFLGLALLATLLHPGSARALTVENTSDCVLYCSVYREGSTLPLTQFVLSPGKKASWTPPNPGSGPFTVRAVAENRPAAPATCTVASHLAGVVAGTENNRLVLGVVQNLP